MTTFEKWLKKHYIPYDDDSQKRYLFVRKYIDSHGPSPVICQNCGKTWGSHSGTSCMGAHVGSRFLLDVDITKAGGKTNPNIAFKMRKMRS